MYTFSLSIWILLSMKVIYATNISMKVICATKISALTTSHEIISPFDAFSDSDVNCMRVLSCMIDQWFGCYLYESPVVYDWSMIWMLLVWESCRVWLITCQAQFMPHIWLHQSILTTTRPTRLIFTVATSVNTDDDQTHKTHIYCGLGLSVYNVHTPHQSIMFRFQMSFLYIVFVLHLPFLSL